jgi:hypothetical protein
MSRLSRRPRQSSIDVRLLDGEWMVVQTMTAEDARAVADAFGPRDGVWKDLYDAADQVDKANAEDDR